MRKSQILASRQHGNDLLQVKKPVAATFSSGASPSVDASPSAEIVNAATKVWAPPLSSSNPLSSRHHAGLTSSVTVAPLHKRGSPSPAPLVTRPQQSVGEDVFEERYFTVMYTKKSNKKHKSYTDGFLVLCGKNAGKCACIFFIFST